ncbi:ester cyclase [Cryptosporangium phraense]|uniref:Ester cyclase n=1 Tax=Cryptosporangium phraense TaxID=2593070 RepID=A0A545B0H3_9ACTN|nr:ester cyclase [Cryptosporangium phraense]TQS47054.1 ester cyclase [Cryptosporangium phraense]
MADHGTIALAQAWADLWNGNLSQTPKIIAENFVSHAAPLFGGAPGDAAGRESLEAWVGGAHQVFSGLTFEIQVGPIADGDFVVVRWLARGTYAGALPGTPAEPREVSFSGTDILRLEDGLIAEYWANADSLWVAQQIGLAPVG